MTSGQGLLYTLLCTRPPTLPSFCISQARDVRSRKVRFLYGSQINKGVYIKYPHPPICFHSGFSCTDLVPPAVSQGRRGGQTPFHKVCTRRHHQGELQSDVAPEQSGHTCCHIESVQSEGIKFEPLCECTYAGWRVEIL